MNVLGALLFLPMLVSSAHSPTDCTHFNVTVVADGSTGSLPPQGTVEYLTSIVDSQYIVTFTSYYTTEARDGFISAALCPFQDWAILPRHNPSSQYPSDFSLVKLPSPPHEHHTRALTALTAHTTIKQVTPQKMLTRLLRSGEGGRGVCVCGGGGGVSAGWWHCEVRRRR